MKSRRTPLRHGEYSLDLVNGLGTGSHMNIGDDAFSKDGRSLLNNISGAYSTGFGRGLIDSGRDNFLSGYKNTISGSYCSILGGSENVIENGQHSVITSGTGNKIASTYSDTGGAYNVVRSYLGFSRGQNNYLGSGHTAVSILGSYNNVPNSTNDPSFNNKSSVLLGENNYLFSYGNATILAGFGLKVNGTSSYRTDGKCFLGKYNSDDADSVRYSILTVGNGSSDTARKNAFEVREEGTIRSYATIDGVYKVGFKTINDGRAQVYGAPQEDNDIIRKLELDESINRLQASIDDEASRAEDIEEGLRDDLNSEVSRANRVEGELNKNIINETTRATTTEEGLRSLLGAQLDLETETAKTLQSNTDTTLNSFTAKSESYPNESVITSYKILIFTEGDCVVSLLNKKTNYRQEKTLSGLQLLKYTTITQSGATSSTPSAVRLDIFDFSTNTWSSYEMSENLLASGTVVDLLAKGSGVYKIKKV